MAIHAGSGRWNCRLARTLDRRVAVPAIEPELAGMQCVAIRDRLVRLIADPERFGGHAVRDQRDQVHRRSEHQEVDPPAKCLGPFGKYETRHEVSCEVRIAVYGYTSALCTTHRAQHATWSGAASGRRCMQSARVLDAVMAAVDGAAGATRHRGDPA